MGQTKEQEDSYLHKINIFTMDILHQFLKYQLPGAVKSERITKSIVTYTGEGKIFIIGTGTPDGIITQPVKENILKQLQQEKNKLYFFSLFNNMEMFQEYSDRIAWGSYVWIATEPEHTVHFDDRAELRGTGVMRV